jgi:hypothetical protein
MSHRESPAAASYYKVLLNNTIEKIKILNELTNSVDDISNLIEKYNTLAIE